MVYITEIAEKLPQKMENLQNCRRQFLHNLLQSVPTQFFVCLHSMIYVRKYLKSNSHLMYDTITTNKFFHHIQVHYYAFNTGNQGRHLDT